MAQPAVITIGRVSMDLFAQQVGVPFEQVGGFDAAVGGSPTNIAIGCSRLGVEAAALTAVGDDEVGRFVLRFLNDEGVDTSLVTVKPGRRTGLALLGIQPPDHFPLTFYRDDPADIQLTVDDVAAAPLTRSRLVLLSGTALSRGTAADATRYAAETAKAAGVTVMIDLDLRPDQWTHPRTYGLAIRSLLPWVDVVVGTEDELWAALASDPAAPPSAGRHDEIERLVRGVADDPRLPDTVVVKEGARGARVVGPGTTADVPGIPVEVLNTVGAGDAFAAGLIAGWLEGSDWTAAARLANACGALVVTRHGCSTAMPTRAEVEELLAHDREEAQ